MTMNRSSEEFEMRRVIDAWGRQRWPQPGGRSSLRSAPSFAPAMPSRRVLRTRQAIRRSAKSSAIQPPRSNGRPMRQCKRSPAHD